MTKKRLKSLKNRDLVPTIQPELDFIQTRDFRKVLDNVELITNMKYAKIWA